MTIKDYTICNVCILCNEGIEIDYDLDPIFSMSGEGPYCELCWTKKQSRGARIIMESLFGKQSQELK